MDTIERNKLLSVLKKDSVIKECFCSGSEDCSGEVVLAHSLQKNGKLSVLESDVNGNLLLYTPTSCVLYDNNLHKDLVPIGKNKASTFFGFCSKHDKKLFQPIEDEDFDIDSDKHCFLHSYRAFAHSYNSQKQMLKAYRKDSEFTLSLDPTYRSESIEGFEIGVKEGEVGKSKLNNALLNEEYDYLDYFVYTLPDLYPVASTGIISPRYSINGAPMNNHINPEISFSDIMLTVFPDKNETLIIYATFPDDEKGKLLLDELETLTTDQLNQITSTFMVFYAENTFFSPKVWDSMNKLEKEKYLSELDFVLSVNFELADKFLLSRTNFFQPKFILK